MQTLEVVTDEYGNIHYYKPGTKILHRENGPAVEFTNGDKEYWLDGRLHRKDKPAIEYTNGTKEWWLNGKLHRENGPAVERANGTKEWWLNGKLHRENGPAVEYTDGSKEYWYLNGKELTEEEWEKQMKGCTTEERCPVCNRIRDIGLKCWWCGN